MAPSSPKWQNLLKLKPADFDAENETDEDRHDRLAKDYESLKLDEFDNEQDLRHAFRLGQQFTAFFRTQKDGFWDKLVEVAQQNDNLKNNALDNAKDADSFLKNEINRLRSENEDYRRSYENTLGEAGQVREELKKCENKVRDLQNQNDALNKLSEDLRKRVSELRDTNRIREDDGERTSRVRAMEKELNSVLDENSQLFNDRQKVNSKAAALQRELEEATRHINELSNEHAKIKSLLNEKDQENLELKNELNIFREQMPTNASDDDDMVMRLVEERVKQWKDIFKSKDDEIDDLKRKIIDQRDQLQMHQLENQKTDITTLNKAVAEKDQQISLLKKKLEEATNDLIKQTDALDRMRSDHITPADPTSTTNRSNTYETNRLRKQLNDYEKELSERDIRLHDLDLQLKAFLDKNYELRDAVQEIRQLKEQIKLRDRQMEDLAQFASRNELTVNEVTDENEELRAKLGMDPRTPMSVEQLKTARMTRTEANQAVVQVLQKEIERLEEERLKLKQNCRQLARQAGVRAAELGLAGDSVWTDDTGIARPISTTADDAIRIARNDYDQQIRAFDTNIDQLRRDLIEKTNENRALITEIHGLEQGLKEIDQQLKQKRFPRSSSGDPSSSYVIQCPSLDKMLQVLESQSHAGRYDGSMVLKSENDKLLGRIAELRDELYNARHEKTKSDVNLKLAVERNEKLQRDLKLFEEAGAVPLTYQSLKLPDGLSPSSRDIISCLNEYLVDALAEVTAQREMNKSLEEGLDKYRRKLNVIKHQTGLLYKDFHEKQQQWLNEREQTNDAKRDLQTEIEKNLVKLQEFDRLLNTLEQDDVEVRRRIAELTRKITVLRVNEKTLGRKILSYQDIETHLRKDNTKLRTEVVDMEVAVQTRLNYLQRFKDTSAYRIKHLQKQVEESVHQNELDKINRKYEDVVEKYRDLLEQQHAYVQQTEQSSVLTEDNRRLIDEVEFLKRQLQIDKEKMHLLEETMENLKNQGLIDAGYTSTSVRSNRSGFVDENPGSLSRKITVLEMKELNERQRAEYAQKLYDQQRTTLRQMEDRNLELEKKFSELTRMNLEMQRTERELRDDLAHSVPRTVSDADKRRISELESTEIHAKQEIGRLREISEVATYQVGAINDMKVLDEKEFQSLRLQLLDLQSKTDDKSEIGKLHRHILALQISEATAKRKQLQSDNDLAKQKALLLRTEQKLDEKEQSLFFIRQEYTQRIRYLRTALQDYRHKYAGALPLRVQESYAKTMIDLRNGKKQLDLDMKKLADQKFDLETQIASYEFKHKSLEELLATLKDGQSNARVQKMIEWQQKLEKVKLNELRHIRLNKRMETDNSHLTKLVQQLEINVTELEEQNVKFEKEIEERQLIWEHRELDMERKIDQLEKQQNDIANAAKRFEEAIGNYPDPSLPVAHQLEQALTIIRDNIHLLMEAKIQHQLVDKKTTEHNDKIREMENAVLARDKVIHELRLRLPTTTILDSDKLISDVMTRPDDSSRLSTVRAAQSTIDSLQARIIQKEESIRKYQDMLKEARDDSNKQIRQHEEEIQLLNEQLQNKRDLDFIRFKDFVERGGNPGFFNGSSSTAEVSRIRELEENVAVQDNTIAHLNEKLREARREAETWKGRLTQKMEQFKHDRENVKSTYEKLVNELSHKIEIQSSQLQDQHNKIGQSMMDLENAQRSTSSRTTTTTKNNPPANTGTNNSINLREQLALKEEQRQELIRALADIRSDMVKIAEGNLKAMSDEDKQSLSVQALITSKTSQLQEKIDDYEGQIQNLKRELKAQKALAQQYKDEAVDAREKLGQNEKKLNKVQQQNATLTDNVQRRMTGQQLQQGQGEDTIESLRRQVRLLEDKLRKTRTAERPLDENRDERTKRTIESFQQQITDLDTHKRELLKFNQQLKDELSKVRLRNEELQKINGFLKSENEGLRNGDSPRSSSSGNMRRIGDSGRSTVELEKIIALMKKKIDHLQSENQILKSDVDRQRIANDSNRAFFTQATESTKEIEHMGHINSRLQKEIALLREQVAQLQMKTFPSSSDNGFH
ncbi:unnamed protein product [Adineta steineri]|uniref:Centrosomal protein of 290kDa coiled-coil region domain-containing protein n=1 Tax=Adineta steineri TaxID=433720 RepID=A0A813MJR3_9BILA|nr:unnamed protein product [Adineta steineri]CAF0832796.1 unnamed protein product [Adineta steineri]